MNTLSIHCPRLSIEMRTPASRRTPVNRGEVNWLPWSVLKISGLPNRSRASSSASMQKSASIVFETRHDSTLRVAQSITATKLEKAAPHRYIRDVCTPDLVRPLDRHPAQQIRIDLVLGMQNRRPWPLIDPFKPHLAHQPPDALAPDCVALAPQMPGHLA